MGVDDEGLSMPEGGCGQPKVEGIFSLRLYSATNKLNTDKFHDRIASYVCKSFHCPNSQITSLNTMLSEHCE